MHTKKTSAICFVYYIWRQCCHIRGHLSMGSIWWTLSFLWTRLIF